MVLEYTHVECCDILFLPFGRSGTGAREFALHYSGRCHADDDLLLQLQRRLRETERVTRMMLVHAGHS